MGRYDAQAMLFGAIRDTNCIHTDGHEELMTNSPGLKRLLQQDEIDHYREHGVVHATP
jgi:hypothetical protein